MPTEQELLDLFNSRSQDETAVRKPAKTPENAAAKDRYDQCQTAIETVVLPYLAGVQKKFGPAKFWYGLHRDHGDGRPSGVSFRVGEGRPTHVSTADGTITVIRGDILDRSANPAGQMPEMSAPGELTAENIARLIEIAILNP
ncbi:hypothetical protein [Labrys monachus]|uniref:Uncharacterized protein n=1 Tax=Labrys monachus TaxID=217067 RepID=A0ABU0FDW0_9HYPH|nr:hypothetical protein [Labrys monachus]MDQ0392798.1 hypothetical protein [Labrys monachus]